MYPHVSNDDAQTRPLIFERPRRSHMWRVNPRPRMAKRLVFPQSLDASASTRPAHQHRRGGFGLAEIGSTSRQCGVSVGQGRKVTIPSTSTASSSESPEPCPTTARKPREAHAVVKALTRTTDSPADGCGKFASNILPEAAVQNGAPIFAVTSASEKITRVQHILERTTRIIHPDESVNLLMELIRSFTKSQTSFSTPRIRNHPLSNTTEDLCPPPLPPADAPRLHVTHIATSNDLKSKIICRRVNSIE